MVHVFGIFKDSPLRYRMESYNKVCPLGQEIMSMSPSQKSNFERWMRLAGFNVTIYGDGRMEIERVTLLTIGGVQKWWRTHDSREFGGYIGTRLARRPCTEREISILTKKVIKLKYAW